MGSRFLRHPFGPTSSSPRLRGTRFFAPRASALLLGVTLAAGAILVAPQTHYAWAAPTVGGDENGPKVQIVSPAYQDVLKGRARILVAVKVTQYNPSTIQLFLDDKPASNVLPLSSFASSTFDWDTRLTADGPHKLSVRVTDTQGFRGWTEVSVYVNNQNVRDTVAPDLNWGNVEAFQQLAGQAQIQLQAKDNFGVKWIIVSLNPVSKSTQQPAQRSWLLSKPPYSFNFDTTKVADGLYSLSARAWDSMEQEGKSPTLTLGIANSPINATTVAESLDGLKAMAKSQGKLGATPTVGAAEPKTVEKSTTPSVGSTKSTTSVSKTPATAKSTIPEGYVLLPKVKPSAGATSAKPRTTAPAAGVNNAAPLLSGSNGSTETTGTESTTATTATPEDGNRVAQLSQPERIEMSASATLSAPGTSGVPGTLGNVLAPAISNGTETGVVKSSDPVLVARLNVPTLSPRTLTEPGDATLSSRESAIASALAPARVPVAEATTQERVQTARVSVPVEEKRGLEVEAVLNSSETSLVNSAPTKLAAPRRNSGASKVVVRQTHQRQPHVVNKIADKVAPAKSEPTMVAEGTALPPATVPQLSQPKVQTDGVVTQKAPVAAVAPRVAALPKTDGRSIEVAPNNALINPVITVSPVRVAFDQSLPSFYQARRTTTLRAVAAHYGLPVELVAATNNWTTDMKILAGMKVQLPRQVQVSYNGQKLRGDVASLLAGDTTFTAMRFLFEHTGGKISWDAAKQEVVARKGASVIRVKIGSKSATVNNKEVMMQLAAFLFEGRTMVPARLFEEGLNAQVEWNPETGRMVVAMVG